MGSTVEIHTCGWFFLEVICAVWRNSMNYVLNGSARAYAATAEAMNAHDEESDRARVLSVTPSLWRVTDHSVRHRALAIWAAGLAPNPKPATSRVENVPLGAYKVLVVNKNV